jgi:hypothetical protein
MSDVDILARLYEFPRSRDWIYKTWEVKVSLLCKDGTACSLKAGKTARTLKQLQAYREFGSPDVSLLDVYICEAGFMSRNSFPPSCLEESLSAKRADLSKGHFGYQLLPFEHEKDGDIDVGLRAIAQQGNPLCTTFHALPSVLYDLREPFSRCAARIDAYFEKRCSGGEIKPFHQIVFCRRCRQLQLIRMRDENQCPSCKADLIVQC